jgi:hypothetical protein
MPDLYHQYLKARQRYNILRLAMQEKLGPLIKEKNGGEVPDFIRDIVDWHDGLRIVISNHDCSDTRHILITYDEVKDLFDIQRAERVTG